MAKVLVVDDDVIIAETIRRMVEKLGHQVVDVCAGGDEAIQAIQSQVPEVLLLDVRLKGSLSGPQLLQRARDDGYAGKAIFLSAYTVGGVEGDLRELEYDAYLTKPVDAAALGAAIDGAYGG